MKTTLALCACTQETDEGTVSAALFKRSDVAVVAIGPAACLRHLYFLAMRLQALEQLHLCCLTTREYALGNFRTKVRERLDRVLAEQTVRGILVYGTCADILMQVDFEELLAGLENPAGIPVKIFCRGPLEKRKMPAVKRLQILYQELEDEMPGPAGELSHPHGEKTFFLPPHAGDFAGVVSNIADPETQLASITYWQMGSLAKVVSPDLVTVAIPILLATGILLLLRWRINVLSLGDREAQSLGVPVLRSRRIVILCATVLTASAVCISGTIGWVGLVIPHFGRMLAGPDNRKLLPLSCLLGGIFLLVIDTCARLMTSAELPLTILTGMVGAPFYVYLLIKQRMKLS